MQEDRVPEGACTCAWRIPGGLFGRNADPGLEGEQERKPLTYSGARPISIPVVYRLDSIEGGATRFEILGRSGVKLNGALARDPAGRRVESL